jgi:hypothetical protein
MKRKPPGLPATARTTENIEREREWQFSEWKILKRGCKSAYISKGVT